MPERLEERLRTWNPWWADSVVPDRLVGVRRDALAHLVDSLDVRHIKDIVGVRRSGKTTLMMQVVAHLLATGVPPRHVTFVNLDDPSLRSASFDELDAAIGTCAPDTTHLLLDEVQEKPEWERWLRVHYDTHRFEQILVTGSSQAVLKGDIGRVLTGRHLSYHVYPFSFAEYLRANGIEDPSIESVAKAKANIEAGLRSYLLHGGMPQTTTLAPFQREQALVENFNDIVERDAAARHALSGPLAQQIATILMRSATKPTSLRRLAAAVEANVTTVARYSEFLVAANLFLESRFFTPKQHPPVQASRKYYAIDCGLFHATASAPGRGPLAETAVAHVLARRGPLQFWTEPGKADVDFVLGFPPEAEAVVQVTVGMDQPNVAERERRSLDTAMRALDSQRGVIVTWSEEEREETDAGTVSLAPLWRFLLDPNRYLGPPPPGRVT